METMPKNKSNVQLLLPPSYDHDTMLSNVVFRPILFNSLMVHALLDGRKTQTRRIVKDVLLQKYKDTDDCELMKITMDDSKKPRIGEIIWVRESFSQKDDRIIYRSQVGSNYDLPDGCKWKPSFLMPKSACRLFLKITNIRLERLYDISEQDAINEGILPGTSPYTYQKYRNYMQYGGHTELTAKDSYKSLWINFNGQESWDDNPFIWVYDFEVSLDCPPGFR